MAFKEYDGLSVEKAIEKLKGKTSHDAEDIAFAQARAEYLSPQELAAITGGEVTESAAADVAADITPGKEAAPAEADGALNAKSHKLDELQAMAAEAGLDTSGTKAELVERLNAHKAGK